MELIEVIKKDLKETLSETRYEHCIGVMKKAEELAKIHGADVEKARLCGLAHDIAKEMTVEESLDYAKKNNVEIDEVEKINTGLLHAKIGADIVKKKYGFTLDMQEAVKYHATANKNMDLLAKIIYVADKTEEGRPADKYNIEYERELASKDLDAALIYIIDGTLVRMIEKKRVVHPNSVETRNVLLMKQLEEQK